MHASLARRQAPGTIPEPFLDRQGARVILGAQERVQPIVPSASTLFGPRGAFLVSANGPLIVCDTGHHRLLVWRSVPDRDNTPADLVVGQPDFHTEGRKLFNVPTGVAFGAGVLALADAWNHRVLLWNGLPQRWDQPADVELCGLNWCYGVAIDGSRLIVADTGNKRVLVWNRIPSANAAPDLVLDEGMRWPHGIAAGGERIFIADAGTNRVSGLTPSEPLSMPYGVTLHHGALVVADTANSRLLALDPRTGSVLGLAGQRSLADKGDNRWGPAARDSLCWPYCVHACERTLVIADTGNNRILLWDLA